MSDDAIPTDLAERFADGITTAADGAWEIAVSAEQLRETLAFLGADRQPAFDYLVDIFAVDYGEQFEVVYHLSRPRTHEMVRVCSRLSRQKPSVQTVTDIWAGASWPEREMMEMYGVAVEGHPDPRNLLLPEGWKGYPLRKDYEYPDDHPWLSRDELHDKPGEYLKQHPVEE